MSGPPIYSTYVMYVMYIIRVYMNILYRKCKSMYIHTPKLSEIPICARWSIKCLQSLMGKIDYLAYVLHEYGNPHVYIKTTLNIYALRVCRTSFNSDRNKKNKWEKIQNTGHKYNTDYSFIYVFRLVFLGLPLALANLNFSNNNLINTYTCTV